jgi:hypothetical protein
MTKIFLRTVIIGTLLFFTLLGLGIIGIRPASKLVMIFCIPSIYVVGPLLNLLPYDWFEGPGGSVMAIMISSWLELMFISLAVGLILHGLRMRSAQ